MKFVDHTRTGDCRIRDLPADRPTFRKDGQAYLLVNATVHAKAKPGTCFAVGLENRILTILGDSEVVEPIDLEVHIR